MTEKIERFEQFNSIPDNLWLPLFELLQQSQLTIESWTPEMASEIYEQLEHPNWAPWLEASETTIAGRATTFPEGQLLMKDHELLVASLSLNQIQWDGDPQKLPTWDQVAGINTTDYSETYNPNGNTLVLMSMNVANESKGKQLPSKLIEYVKLLAQELGVEHVIGSFRPSGYGQIKLEQQYQAPDFWTYCQMKVPGTQKPLDPWLRSLWWAGMQMLKEDSHAMQIQATDAEVVEYKKTYHPEMWQLTHTSQAGWERWECGEVGEWFIKQNVNPQPPRYRESNVWGVIPFK